MAQAIRNPDTKDFMTTEELDSYNLERFKAALTEGSLGNTGPWGINGWGFGSGRWEKYFQERPDLAEEVDWEVDDTTASYMSRAKNRKEEEEIDYKGRGEPADRPNPLDDKGSGRGQPATAEPDSREWFTAEGGDERYEKIPFTDEELEDLIVTDTDGIEVGSLSSDNTGVGYPEGESSRGDDNSFETKEQQKERIRKRRKKEENARNLFRWEKKYEERRAEHKDKDLDEEFTDFENEVEEDKLNAEFSDFEGELKKEKELEKEKTSKRFDNKEGMLNPLVVEEHTAFLGEIESAGFKGVEAVKLAKKLASLCGSRQ